MCTVVLRHSDAQPSQILALRDEVVGREFDDPDEWWPQFPGVIGGRDHTAGGTWCAARVASGVAALVLNRPQKRAADPGANSRGLLPLLGVWHELEWPSQIDLSGMASFALVLVMPDRVTSWTYDGEDLHSADHPRGTHMFTSGGDEDGKASRYLADFQGSDAPAGWRRLVDGAVPADDPAALVVHHEQEGIVFATVFAQLIGIQPGRLDLQYSRRPASSDRWQTRTLS